MNPSKTGLNAIALISIVAVAIALLSQHVWNMPPCAWCVFQRLIYLVIAVVAWVGVAGNPKITRAMALLVVVLAIGGALSAWYQYDVAAQQFSCDLTFADRFITGSGLEAAIPWLFGIYATCMDARVTILGVEYAILSLILYLVIAALALRTAVPAPSKQT